MTKELFADFLTRAEVDQDFCPHRYGDSTDGGFCDAALGVTGSRKCRNTRPTCQDPDNFARTGLQALFNGVDFLQTAGNVSGLSFPYRIEVIVSEFPADNWSAMLDFTASDGFHIFRASGDLRCRWGSGTQLVILDDLSEVERIHFEVEVDGEGRARFFVNGMEKDIDDQGAPREFGPGVLNVGASSGGNEVMPDGSAVQEIRVWSGTASPSVRRRNLWKSVRFDDPGLMHYWPIGSVNGEGFKDMAGGVDLTGSLAVGIGHSVSRLILKFSMGEQDLIPGHIPSIHDVDTAPSKLSPGEGIGRRASGSVTFNDHPSPDFETDPYRAERISGDAQDDGIGYDPAKRGTFWGKWRAANYQSFKGRGIRVVQVIGERERMRNYVMESLEGIDRSNRFTIEFMDPLIQLDGDRAQAPIPNTGLIQNEAGITDEAGQVITLKPAGIGDEEYSAEGIVAIGRECAEFTRVGDEMTLGDRGVLNTSADSHDENDVVQDVLYLAGTADEIQRRLAVEFSGVDPAFVNNEQWQQEAADHIGLLFEAYITEPTSTRKLTKELTEQAGFDLYWDEIQQTIPFVALKEPEQIADVVGSAFIIDGTLNIRDQQGKRVSQVWVNYGLIDPTQRLDDKNNFRNLHKGRNFDTEGVMKWQSPKIKKIFSRWLNQFNQPGAEQADKKILSRFSIPPRALSFSTPLWRDGYFHIGQLLRIEHPRLQRDDGGPESVEWQVQSIERTARELRIECEEFRLVAALGQEKPIFITSDAFNFNLREAWESVWGNPQAGDVVVCRIEAIVGSVDAAIPAFDVGDWPDGVTIRIKRNAEFCAVGRAGNGGQSGLWIVNQFGQIYAQGPGDGSPGGVGFYTRVPVILEGLGTLGGGAGGGGGGSSRTVETIGPLTFFGGVGGGGAGHLIGQHGTNDDSHGPDGIGEDGAEDGTLEHGGAAGGGGGPGSGGDGGDGGDMGQDGQDGDTIDPSYQQTGAGSGGAAGAAIDGISFVTFDGPSGDIRGQQIN
jgi:hypothetical protein